MVVWSEKIDRDQELELLKRHLATQFENVDEIPPWRLLVCARDNQLSVTFLFHHSLGDGTTGTIFLRELCKSLNSSTPSQNSIIEIPSTQVIRPSLESVLSMPQGIFNMIKIAATAIGLLKSPESPWTGPPNSDTFSPGKSSLEPKIAQYSISAEDMHKLLIECRRHGTTITALLTAIGVLSLDFAIQDDSYKTIISSVPRNLRPIIEQVSGNDMGVFVASVGSVFDRTKLKFETSDFSDVVWATSNHITGSIQDAIKKRNAELNSGLLKYVGNMRQFLIKSTGKQRLGSIVMSSLVVEKTSELITDEWTLDDFYFTQCVNSLGFPINLCTISYKGGALNMTCTWASEIVPDNFVSRLMERYETNIDKLIASF